MKLSLAEKLWKSCNVMPDEITTPSPRGPINKSASTNALFVAFGDKIPVDDVEKRGHIFGPAILIFQIIGMFPNVNTEQRLLALTDR